MAAAVMVAVVTEVVVMEVVAIWVVVTWAAVMSADLAARPWEGLAVPGWADLGARSRGPAQSLQAWGWGGAAWAWVPGQG